MSYVHVLVTSVSLIYTCIFISWEKASCMVQLCPTKTWDNQRQHPFDRINRKQRILGDLDEDHDKTISNNLIPDWWLRGINEKHGRNFQVTESPPKMGSFFNELKCAELGMVHKYWSLAKKGCKARPWQVTTSWLAHQPTKNNEEIISTKPTDSPPIQ